MPLRLCLGWNGEACSALVNGNRCATHEAMSKRARNARAKPNNERRPDYTWAERQRRAEAVRMWRAEYGDWCPGWRERAAHAVIAPNILTADHADAVASGGAESGDLVVRCRSCNSARGSSPIN